MSVKSTKEHEPLSAHATFMVAAAASIAAAKPLLKIQHVSAA